jgi:DNA-binding NarL/FixJ family response regulator
VARDNQVAIVADEQALCGAGLLHMVESCLGFSRVLTCRNFSELAGILGQYRSRVGLAVIHYGLPGMNRTNGLRRLCEAWPSVPILVTGDGCDKDTVLEVFSGASHGFIPQSSSSLELEHALRTTAGGQLFVPPMSVDCPASDNYHPRTLDEAQLTARQKEVLDLLAAGNSNKQIARALGISEGTVKVHVNAAFRALGVHNRVNAATALIAFSELADVG